MNNQNADNGFALGANGSEDNNNDPPPPPIDLATVLATLLQQQIALNGVMANYFIGQAAFLGNTTANNLPTNVGMVGCDVCAERGKSEKVFFYMLYTKIFFLHVL